MEAAAKSGCWQRCKVRGTSGESCLRVPPPFTLSPVMGNNRRKGARRGWQRGVALNWQETKMTRRHRRIDEEDHSALYWMIYWPAVAVVAAFPFILVGTLIWKVLG